MAESDWHRESSGILVLSRVLGSGSVESSRNLVHSRGVDPLLIRAAVLLVDGSEMTPSPGEVEDEIRPIGQSDGTRLVHVPIWTEGGRSSLSMVVALYNEPGHNWKSSHVEQVVDASGTVMLPTDDPATLEQLTRLAEASRGPEPRIRRSAFVGASPGVLVGQLIAGMERALGDDPLRHLRQLTPGQASVAVVDHAFGRIYGDGLPSAYDSGDPAEDLMPDLLVAAALIFGARRYADLFTRIRDWFPEGCRNDAGTRQEYLYELENEEPHPLDVFEDEFYALEDTGDVIWDYLLAYVDAHPEQFFC